MQKTLDAIIAEHPFFRDLPTQYLDLISGCAVNTVFAQGRFVCREGADANRFYVLRHGKVALEVAAAGRDPLVTETLGPGQVLGWSWLIPPYVWNFDALAIQPVRAISIDGVCLRQKCERDHDLGYELMKRFARLYGEQVQALRLQLMDVYCAAPVPPAERTWRT